LNAKRVEEEVTDSTDELLELNEFHVHVLGSFGHFVDHRHLGNCEENRNFLVGDLVHSDLSLPEHVDGRVDAERVARSQVVLGLQLVVVVQLSQVVLILVDHTAESSIVLQVALPELVDLVRVLDG